jgi:predicted dehydrogenase
MIRLAIIGCGGMGQRHLAGLIETEQVGINRFDLVGACDPVSDNAQELASLAQKHFDEPPVVASNLHELTRLVDVDAVDITAPPQHHHTLAIDALQRACNVMVEKPLGVTVRACKQIWTALQTSDCVLSVAENYRRDPINRLAKALLQEGAIGVPRLLAQTSVGGGDDMVITVWRHNKATGGVLLDVGVHFADIIEYFLGEVESVYAQTRLYEHIRRNTVSGGPAGVYTKWQNAMPATFEATAEDAVYATLQFKSGVVGQYALDHAGHGERVWQRMIFGSQGSLKLPRDRSGQPITLTRDGEAPISNEDILNVVPDFRLDPVTTTLFGEERLWRYNLSFPEIDRKIIAIEFDDYARAIHRVNAPEVEAYHGMRSVALSYALLESGTLGRVVTVDEVLSGLDTYQHEIDVNARLL